MTILSRSRRGFLHAACAASLVGCGTPQLRPPSGPPGLRLIGEIALPHKHQFQGTTVGGLSGIDFDPATGLWAAVCDDRSELHPARFYTLRVDVSPQRLEVELLSAVALRGADGRPYPPRRAGGEVVDPEALRLLPQGRGVLWASEGDIRVNQPPAVHESRLDGAYVRSFEVPKLLHFPNRPGTGPRDNNSFEGLALTPDTRTAWVSMEAALEQDGPVPRVNVPGGPCRFTAFDVASGQPSRQIAYLPDAVTIAPALPGGFVDNGVAEVLMLDAHRMLVLERAFAMGRGNSLRLYEIDTRQASDTLRVEKLATDGYRAADKRLVADFAALGLSRIDNTEGMCWGPRLPGGRRSLVVVSDDNFNASQVTQFAAFEYLE